MSMEMKIYHCDNPEENPTPYWMKKSEPEPEPKEPDLVEQFKKSPDSFFPPFYGMGKRER